MLLYLLYLHSFATVMFIYLIKAITEKKGMCRCMGQKSEHECSLMTPEQKLSSLLIFYNNFTTIWVALLNFYCTTELSSKLLM